MTTGSDVCLIVEGCYPYVAGGVSSWLDWLIRSQPDTSFSVVSIVAGSEPRRARYARPANLCEFYELNINDTQALSIPPRLTRGTGTPQAVEIAGPLAAMIDGGGARELQSLLSVVGEGARAPRLENLMNSTLSWEVITSLYDRLVPHASFLQFFWAWRTLIGGLFAITTFPLPKAGIYHTISTGYAGLLAARAALETGRPAIVTEHGIYTNERRIDILMADWIADTIDKGLALNDERRDVRDLWIEAFEAYARCCYGACTYITTLYAENQILQKSLGADAGKLRVIPNGINAEVFANLTRASDTDRPTIALIGRVVPIKDVKTYIVAAAAIRERIPDLRALIMGPMDEDAAYYLECSALVHELGLDDCITFTGNVRIIEHLPQIHVVVLTSLSEAQPLVLLEAGAAGIPCVTTNVGCCRELLEGARDESPPLGRAGYVTDAVAPDQIADAVARLLEDHDGRRAAGDTLKTRVTRYYTQSRARDSYSDLYRDALAVARRPMEAA